MDTIWRIVVVLKIQLMNSDLVVSISLFGSHLISKMFSCSEFHGMWRKNVIFSSISYLLILCEWVFHLHVCLCTMCPRCSLRSEEDVESPGAQVTDSHELPSGCWESNLGLCKSISSRGLFIAWISRDLYVENATQSCWHLTPINNFMTWLIFAISILEMILQRNGWRWI